jgi:hypothetical protein
MCCEHVLATDDSYHNLDAPPFYLGTFHTNGPRYNYQFYYHGEPVNGACPSEYWRREYDETLTQGVVPLPANFGLVMVREQSGVV